MPTIVPLENVTQGMTSLIGKKALHLAVLQKRFLVPRAVILTNSLFQQFLEQTGIKRDVEKIISRVKAKPEESATAGNLLKECILATSFPEEILEEIKEAYATLSSNEDNEQKSGQKNGHKNHEPLVAVRPSSIGYDKKDIHTSILSIRGIDRLQKAILLCWASFYNPTALEYRLQQCSENTAFGFAVILQEMIDSQAAGIFHTQYKMNPQEVHIIGCKGLGSALTNGAVAVDHYFITKKTLRTASIELGKQTFILERDPETDNTTMVYLQTEFAEKQKIADRYLGELTLLSEKIEALFGKPQVVDFAIANEQIFLLGAYEPEWYKEQLQRIMDATKNQEVLHEQAFSEKELQEQEEEEQQAEEEISYGIVEELDKDQLIQVAINGGSDEEPEKSMIFETKQYSTNVSPSFSREALSQEAAEERKEDSRESFDINEVISSIDPFALEQEMANAAFRWEQERSEKRTKAEEQQDSLPQKNENKQEETKEEPHEFADFQVLPVEKRFAGELTAVQKAAGTLILHCFKELKQKIPREQWATKQELRHVTILAQNFSEKNIAPMKEQVLYALNAVEKNS